MASPTLPRTPSMQQTAFLLQNVAGPPRKGGGQAEPDTPTRPRTVHGWRACLSLHTATMAALSGSGERFTVPRIRHARPQSESELELHVQRHAHMQEFIPVSGSPVRHEKLERHYHPRPGYVSNARLTPSKGWCARPAHAGSQGSQEVHCGLSQTWRSSQSTMAAAPNRQPASSAAQENTGTMHAISSVTALPNGVYLRMMVPLSASGCQFVPKVEDL
eukprot:358454-Chlamydomonas_euryale.AAC.1